MSDGSSIEWCDATWTPVVGCTRVSAGCDNCYAINTVHRFRKSDGLTKLRPKSAARPGLDWTGKVLLQPERLADPLRWRKPRRVFVCSQADLFHDQVPFKFIARVFGVMSECRQHTMIVLTKRIERAREFLAWLDPPSALPNVHIGVSVEDQATADERIPVLLKVPAAVRWVSYEPALGPVTFDKDRGWLSCGVDDVGGPHVDWIVVGGESGPRARPFHVEWALSTIEQCRDTGARAFVKQLGTSPRQGVPVEDIHGTTRIVKLADYAGGDMSEWPADLRVREFPT